MKLVLHIGQQKAGSTALQDVLQRNADALAKQGVLFPLPSGRNRSQQFLVGRIFEEDRWPRMIKHIEKEHPGRTAQRADQITEQLASAAKDGRRFHTAVISTEYLFRELNEGNQQRLRKDILSIFDDIQIVAYIRDPVSRHLSQCLQRVRHSSAIPKISRPTFRGILESYLQLPETRMHVRALDRDTLIGGSIITDFFGNFVQEVDQEALDLEVRVGNEQFSPEVGVLMQEYRQLFLPDADDTVDHRGDRLRVALEAASAELGLTRRGKLRDEVQRAIAFEAREDVEWLAEIFGAKLNMIDTSGDAAPPAIPEMRQIRDVCEIDEAALTRLAWALILKGLC